MTTLTVKIKKEKYSRHESEYRVYVTDGNFSTSTGHYVIQDWEEHPKFPGQTLGEIKEDFEKGKLKKFSKDLNLHPLRPITTLDEAYSTTAKMIKSLSKDHSIKYYSQPKYIHYNENQYEHDLFEDAHIIKDILDFIPSLVKLKIEHTKVDTTAPTKRDVITIQNMSNSFMEFPRLKVVKKRGELGIKVKTTPIETKKSFLTLSELKEIGYEITEVYRETRKHESDYDLRKPKFRELTIGIKPRKYSMASLYESRKNAKSVYDYIEGRIQNGDPLFDQYLVDMHKESREAVEHLEKLIDAIKEH